MSIAQDLVRDLRKGVGDDPWHGPSTMSLIEGLTAAEAAARPILPAHSVWEIVLHMTAWQREVARRLRDGLPASPREGDWPVAAGVSDADWNAAKAELQGSLEDLVLAVQAFPFERWTAGVGHERNPAEGTGLTYQATVSGVVQHNAYHSGQIAILRRALSGQ